MECKDGGRKKQTGMKKDDFDGQCQSQREGKDDKDKKINERVFFFCVFFILRSPPCCLGTVTQEAEG